MLKVYDKDHRALCHISRYKDDIYVDEELDGGDKTLSFSYIGEHDIQNEYYVETKDDEFVVKEVNRDTKTGYVTIVCALNLEGLETQNWPELNLYSQTVSQCATFLLQGTGWILGHCDVTRVRNVGMVEVSSKKALQDVAYAFICDVKFDSKNKVVSFYEKMGQDKGVYFLSGLNLRKLQKTSKSYDFYTRIVPIGADGLTIASVNGGLDYLENHQYSTKIITYLWKDENYDDASALKEDAEKKLADLSKPEVSYTADVIDLARENPKYSVMQYGLGDTVTIIDRGTFTKDVQRIKKLRRYLRNPSKNTCEISNVSLTFDEILSRLRSSEIRVNHTINSDGTIHVSDILNLEGAIYESEAFDEISTEVQELNKKYTKLEDLIGDANILTAKDISVTDVASTTDGLTKKRVTIGTGEDAISYDFIDNGAFVLLGNSYGSGAMGGSGYYTQIDANGLLRANNALIYGTIYATYGEFKGSVRTSDIIIANSIKMSTKTDMSVSKDVLNVYDYDIGYHVELTGTQVSAKINNSTEWWLVDGEFYLTAKDSATINSKSVEFETEKISTYCTKYDFYSNEIEFNAQRLTINNRIAISANNGYNAGIWSKTHSKWLIYIDSDGTVKAPGLSGGGANVIVDSSISSTSTNPVQNKVIYSELSKKQNAVSGTILTTNNYSNYISYYVYDNMISLASASGGKVRLNVGGWGGISHPDTGYGFWFDKTGAPKISNAATYASNSDRRLKIEKGFIDVDETKIILSQIDIAKFTYKDPLYGGCEEIGIFAQDLRDLLLKNNLPNRAYIRLDEIGEEGDSSYNIRLPEALYYYSVDYRKFIPLLWKGWQIHDTEIKNSWDIITDLRIEVAELKREIQNLKAS